METKAEFCTLDSTHENGVFLGYKMWVFGGFILAHCLGGIKTGFFYNLVRFKCLGIGFYFCYIV